MLTTPIEQLAVPGARFAREPGVTGTGRRDALEGDARPGDAPARTGGALVHDVHGNGRVDGFDAIADDRDVAPRHGALVDTRA